jgi:protein O-GlcNAc transferase
MLSKDEALTRDAVRLIDEGNAIEREGRINDAMRCYEDAILLAPTLARAHLNRGNVLLELGNTEAALDAYATALVRDPNYAGAHYNIGNAHVLSGQHEAALAAYRAAIALNPDFTDAEVAMGCVHEELGQLDAAVTSYRRALKIDPNYIEVHCNLGNALRALGQVDDAIEQYRRALAIKPDHADAHNCLGSALSEVGRLDDAAASYRRAVKLKPEFSEAHNNLASVLRESGQVVAAVASYERALRINPNYAEAQNNLGHALQDLGQAEEAVSSYRRALAIKPDFADAHSSLLFCLSHNEAMGIQALLAEHRRFGEQFEAPLRASWPQHGNGRDAERCLQVGFVSGDLRDHAVAYFLEPILGYLAAYPGLSLHAYYNHATEGSITPRLRNHFRHWHRIAGLSDAALAQKIAADGIDILIDLSGHTGENRLLCFARKPAPVQVSWMGYPGTTGLSAMDYYLADRYFLPPGKFDDQFTEKLVHLPASAPFLPDRRAPPVNALPALSNGYLTFGSFNRLSKLTASAVAMWSRLLQALPDARMVIGGMPKDGSSAMLVDWFARGGVARDRLSFHPRCDVAAYLAMHAQIDICLDTFPYTGGTTTNHALWMGVPTLTLAGQTVSSRQGAAILGHVGLEAFVADDADDFQKKGLYWAGDPVALAAVRAGLRARCTQSPIRSPELIAAGLEHALRTMWRRWCARLPAETFEARPHHSM